MVRNKLARLSIVVAIPVAYALLMRLASGRIIENLLAVMSVSFLVGVPFVMGVTTISMSDLEKVQRLRYRIFMPWLPVVIFFVLTILFAMEGWACWIMALPIWLLAATLGGLTAGYYKLKRARRDGRLKVSLIFLLPLVLGPVERLIPVSSTRYEAYTSIDIHAGDSSIWANVVRVRTIPASADRGTVTRFLGFPRPVRAELDYAGVGGSRKAVFTGGLVFDEVVKEYEPRRQMCFSIRANPHDIPSTTMDEHIVIGGDYFDVLDGTYRLGQLNDTTCRLHLFSHFELKTDFNFYAGWWAGWIMRDIQNNILQVIKRRAESPSAD